MSKPGLSGQLAEEYCRKFPAAPSISIARLLCKDHPAVFLSVDQARTAVRHIRGSQGIPHQESIIRSGRLIERLDLPEPEPPEFKIYDLPPGPKRWLILADVQAPYHEVEAIRVALRFGKAQKCDGLLFLGDLPDYYQLSPWLRDPRRRNFVAELDAVEEVILIAQEYLRPKQTVWKAANHEYRFERYLMRRAPEFFGLQDWLLPEHLQFKKRNITWIPRGCPIQYKDLTLLHGDEWQGGMTSPVNPARTAFLKGRECAIVAHQHRTSEHTEPTLRGITITCWSVGCLCNLHPEYAPLNQWNHGFAILDISGKWRVGNYRIVGGEVV